MNFPCMLAEDFYSCSDHVLGKQFIITQKVSGKRCLAFCLYPDPWVKLILCEDGSEHIGDAGIKRDLCDMLRETRCDAVLDGVLVGDKFHVFDFVDPENIGWDGVDANPYIARRRALDHYIGQKYSFVKAVPILYQGNDPAMITRELNKQLALGHDGVMVNILDAPYERERTKNLLYVSPYRIRKTEISLTEIKSMQEE